MQTRAAGYFFLGWQPKNGKTIRLNGALLVLSIILKCVAALAVEAELGALFINFKEALILSLALKELGHPQPLTPIHVGADSAAAHAACLLSVTTHMANNHSSSTVGDGGQVVTTVSRDSCDR